MKVKRAPIMTTGIRKTGIIYELFQKESIDTYGPPEEQNFAPPKKSFRLKKSGVEIDRQQPSIETEQYMNYSEESYEDQFNQDQIDKIKFSINQD
jgi:hypothetical protein